MNETGSTKKMDENASATDGYEAKHFRQELHRPTAKTRRGAIGGHKKGTRRSPVGSRQERSVLRLGDYTAGRASSDEKRLVPVRRSL